MQTFRNAFYLKVEQQLGILLSRTRQQWPIIWKSEQNHFKCVQEYRLLYVYPLVEFHIHKLTL